MIDLGVGILVSAIFFVLGEWRGRRAMQESVRQALTVRLALAHESKQDRRPASFGGVPAAVGYVESTNDGRRQLLMMRGVGAHSTRLDIYGRPTEVGPVERLGKPAHWDGRNPFGRHHPRPLSAARFVTTPPW